MRLKTIDKKMLVFTALWFSWGAIIWAIRKEFSPANQLAIMGTAATLFWMALAVLIARRFA